MSMNIFWLPLTKMNIITSKEQIFQPGDAFKYTDFKPGFGIREF